MCASDRELDASACVIARFGISGDAGPVRLVETTAAVIMGAHTRRYVTKFF